MHRHMFHAFWALSLTSPAMADVVYVDLNATGPAHDGSTWCNAYLNLQDALAVATTGDEIRVAAGIYRPDQGGGLTPGDRGATFQLKSGVAVFGGYAGCDAFDPDQRDIDTNQTILSGDLLSDDEPGSINEFIACFDKYEPHAAGCEVFDLTGDDYVDRHDLPLFLDNINYEENSYHVITGRGVVG